MRIFAVLGTLAVAASLVPPIPVAVAGDAPTCPGQVVTIDLNDPEAPDETRDESDVILGTPGFDVIFAGAGDDVVCGLGGADSIYLGPGDDVARSGVGNDLVEGGPGTDTIDAGKGADFVAGGGAPDGIREEIRLGSGNDAVIATGTDELIEAGPGIDAVSYHAVRPGRGGVRVDLALIGPQDTGAGGMDELTGIEQVNGTGRADVLLGDAGRNDLAGGPGDDRLVGRGGRDHCWGNGGTDTIRSCEMIGDRP